MPRVIHVKKARKAIPSYDIKVGDSYYWWAFMVGGRGGPKRCSKTPPKPSQLTQSEFWGAVYSLRESHESAPSCVEDFQNELQEIKDDLQNILDETQGKYDNLPDGLQQGQSGELLQERIDAVESAISDLDSVDDSPDDKEDDETEEDYTKRVSDWVEEKWTEVTDAVDSISCS